MQLSMVARHGMAGLLRTNNGPSKGGPFSLLSFLAQTFFSYTLQSARKRISQISYCCQAPERNFTLVASRLTDCLGTTTLLTTIATQGFSRCRGQTSIG